MKKTAMFFIILMGMCTFFTVHALAGSEGVSNTFYGFAAGSNIPLMTDLSATFIGAGAGYSNTYGDNNTFLGYYAGYANTTGSRNTFLGRNAGDSNTTGHNNTFLGYYTGDSNTTGSSNTFLGDYAGQLNTTGYFNTFLGRNAGHANTTGYGNILIGYRAGYNETGSNKLYIDNTDTSSPLIYGEFDNDLVRIHGTLEMAEAVSLSDARMKKNVQPLIASLDKVSMLKGVSFDWKTEAYADRGLSDDKQIGLIAQDVEKVLPELVKTGTDGYKSVSYAKLTAVLVEAIKELKSEQKELKDENQALKTQIEEIKEHQAMLETILKNRTYSSSSSNSISMAAGDPQ